MQMLKHIIVAFYVPTHNEKDNSEPQLLIKIQLS